MCIMGKTNPKPFGLTGCTANFSIVNFVNKNGAPVVSKIYDCPYGRGRNLLQYPVRIT